MRLLARGTKSRSCRSSIIDHMYESKPSIGTHSAHLWVKL